MLSKIKIACFPMMKVQRNVGIINRLMKEYVSCDIESSKTLGRQLNPQELRKRLIFELNRRGLYVDMKEKLRESMHALAKEKFDAGTSARLLPICSPLYAFMLDEMHASINQAMGVQDNPTDHADHATSLQLTRIAAECEMQGDMQRAKKLHEQRCAHIIQSSVLRVSNWAELIQ